MTHEDEEMITVFGQTVNKARLLRTIQEKLAERDAQQPDGHVHCTSDDSREDEQL